jgi:cardiolipin synthase
MKACRSGPFDRQSVRPLLEQTIGVPFTEGNDVRILQNGVEIFPTMLEAIDAAERRIDFATFVYWSGEIARRFADALAEKAHAGVRVRVLLDAIGAKPMRKELLETMSCAGVEIRWFRPIATWRLWRTDKRGHRKILVCDDAVAFTGGVGIADEWEGDARNPDEWRDTHVAISGPAINGLRAAFLDNWREAGAWEFEDTVARPASQDGGVAVQVVRGSATVGWTDMATMLRSLVSMSQERLRITTAYFNPDSVLVTLLLEAIERHVDVRLLVPGRHCDSRLSQLAGHASMCRLLEAGARFWMYHRTMLHAKVVTVDSCVSMIGSPNFNHRSMGKDEECCVIVLSEDVVGRLDTRFDSDCAVAEEQAAGDWKSRGAWLRLKERGARILQEQL